MLGLHNSPDKVDVIFVGEAEDEKGSTPWYKWNHDTNTPIPVHEDALTGYIYNIVINTKTFKDKTNYKLNIYVKADHNYIIKVGAGTTFARGFVLAMQKIVDLKGSITISVKQGDDSKAVFCGIYQDGVKVMPDWDGEVQLLPLINKLQEKMGLVVQTKELIEDKEKYYAAVQEHRDMKNKPAKK